MKRVKINIEETKFIINNDKKTVTCIIDGEYQFNQDSISTDVILRAIHKNQPPQCNYGSEWYPKFIGQCKYKEGDTFDSKLACSIAESKAKRQMFANISNISKSVCAILKEEYINFYDDSLAAESYKTRENEHIKDLITE